MMKFLNISTDTTLGGVSPADDVVVSQKAVKTYIDNQSGGGGGAPTSIDAEMVGALTVASNGDVSGFSNSKYLLYPGSLDMTGASSFEMVFAFTMSPYPTGGSIIGGEFIYEHQIEFSISSSKLYLQVFSGTSPISTTGTTTIVAGTKYYAKVVYDGTDYTLYLSTDGSTWNTEATMAATYLPGIVSKTYQLGRRNISGKGIQTMHMAECYIKKNGVLVWRGIDCPGLHQRASNMYEVVDFQLPTSGNNYTWYIKFANNFVIQGGFGTTNGGNATPVSLPITMADSNYSALLQGRTASDGYTNAQWQVMPVITTASPTTTTSFYVQGSITGYNLGFKWVVTGMAA